MRAQQRRMHRLWTLLVLLPLLSSRPCKCLPQPAHTPDRNNSRSSSALDVRDDMQPDPWDGARTPRDRAQQCQHPDLLPLYAQIPAQLEYWAARGGITQHVQMQAVRYQTCREHGQKGIAVGFKGGRAYLTDVPVLPLALNQHISLLITYMKVMVLLEQWLGPELPDVEFVISTVDRPLAVASAAHLPLATQPVFRFCKSNASSDLLIPNFHSYMEKFTGGVAAQAAEWVQDNPWEERSPILFGRFTPYQRHMHSADPHTDRMGADGRSICITGKNTRACQLRTYFCDWAQQHAQLMDISCTSRVSMAKHAERKYLLHLDGQGLSSRFEQLVRLGAVVLREESGYYAYWYHLVQPGVHYLPFWQQGQGPESVLDQLAWAKQHDAEAKQIARNAGQVAEVFLGPKGRACYWLELLKGYAKLQTYKPGPNGTSQYSQYWRPVAEWLEQEPIAAQFGSRYTFRP